ncbi:aminopeptidase II [Coriobacterium glomerans PW2]|uniref:Aminopeptidase II n=1 Tax=Coriobacterium glomerans (strain ATCC 49209 / DSM 20642 / JCM 10262 / PW2) TaxID=700015 RepID=F2N6X3_CORGP|nr:aminopeptidase [Coriobacterium glomerans]AEB06172.1 aminopeptidase II [Coriobacterium glomerans PW2]
MIRAELTAEDACAGMVKLMPKIERYADLIIRRGVNVRSGQEVVVEAAVEQRRFAELLTRKAYAAGAAHVTVIWRDDAVTRLTYEHVDLASLERVPEWERVQLESLAQAGACFVFVEGADPAALQGIDPAKPATAASARNSQCKSFRRGLDFNINPWCCAGAPVPAWARHVFPDACEEVALYRLWCAILSAARADGEDPESDWELHDATFEKNLRFLNEHHFASLRYRSKNGTDLTVGMTDRHIWAGGKAETPQEHPFFPNVPTEEVFTSPDCEHVEGIVHAALPVIHHGTRIDRFWLRFEAGRVVDYDAEVGVEALRSIIELDRGSSRLGEVALISKNTPIRESGILFFDTLYDENASCHLALGIGFPECYEGGYDMTPEKLRKKGVNMSSTHVDFMIGADDLNICGMDAEGRETSIFVNGQWSWE